MLLKIYKTLTGVPSFEEVQVNSISELKTIIESRETLSKYMDKKVSANGFVCRKLDEWQDIPLEFSWIDVDGANHEGVSRDTINAALRTLLAQKIPFLVFRTQHENCYKIICHVTYKSGKAIDYDEYKQINEKFQKWVFAICKLKDYEEGSCSPTKGFCLSKNGLISKNESEQPFVISFAYEAPKKENEGGTMFNDIQKTEKEKFEYALKFVTTDICPTFEDWTACAMALNNQFGEGGLEYFRIISNYYSGKQHPAEVDKKYRACKNAQRVSIGTIYKLISDAGIVIDWANFYEREKITNNKKAATKAAKTKAAKDEYLKKFTDEEDKYYAQVHEFFSTTEAEELLQDNGFDLKKYTFSYSATNSLLIFEKGEPITLNKLFANKFDVFAEICTTKHIAMWSDVINDKFSFNFTTEELINWLCSYPQTIFRNYEYNRALHNIMPTVKNSVRFNIERTVKSKIKNLFNSQLNVQKKPFKEFLEKINEALPIFCEEFEESPVIPSIKQNNGWIDDVLVVGRKYIASHEGADTTDYWFDALTSIFTMSASDFNSLVSFTIDSIKVRLYGDIKAMRSIIVTGDSGIGKDSFLQGLLTGLNFKQAEKVILRGSIYGATKFSAAKIEKFKQIMYNYISDDLSAANESTNLDTITATAIGIENKGKDKKSIQKRFNSVITNNDPHVLFAKDRDPNAIARRVNFCAIKYAEGCNSNDYRKLYTVYDGKFDEFWAGFFTFCFELEKFDNEINVLVDAAREYTLENLHNLFYSNNEDSRILDMLAEVYRKHMEKSDPFSNPDSGNELLRHIKGVEFLVIRSLAGYWTKDNKFSENTIKRVVKAHVRNARLESSYRDDYGTTKRAAIMIPTSFFQHKPEEVEFTGIKTNLVENFKKYI